MGRHRDLVFSLLLGSVLLGSQPAVWCHPGDPPGSRSDGLSGLSDGDLAFLSEAAVLLTDRERTVFMAQERAYRRSVFIERFWRSRDPFPETGSNELLEVWKKRRELALGRFPSLTGDRARAMLLLGPPKEVLTGFCAGQLRPMEIWRYEVSSDPSSIGLPGSSLALADLTGDFHLVFVETDNSSPDGFTHWQPELGLESLLPAGGSDRGQAAEGVSIETLVKRCLRGVGGIDALLRAVSWKTVVAETGLVPVTDDGWLEEFLERTTDPSTDADPLSVTLAIEFPGSHQSRTVVQGILAVPRSEVRIPPETDGRVTLRVDGEIVRHEKLVESFRYRFEPPAGDWAPDELTMVIQRYLHPADYDLYLKIRDLGSGGSRLLERRLLVPSRAGTGFADTGSAGTGPLLSEADASLSAGEHIVRILPPPERLHTGRLRVEARAIGKGIHRVAFLLDGRPVMSKTRPPFSVELDLGRAPRPHTLVAVALDPEGRELARDRFPINAGPHRFGIRLLEPRAGKEYRKSLRAQAEVDLPRGESLDRAEFFVNETRQATLYQPPFVQPLLLPVEARPTYVRVVAYLEDGNRAEDLVFVNSAERIDSLRVNFVELFTTVVDRSGHPVEGLGLADFSVAEDGIDQRIARFERVRDLPIHAGIMLDTSSSMADELPDAVRAGLRFFEGVITPRDRASVVVFNDEPDLKVPFTNRIEVLTGGLENLRAEGDTALYDSLLYTLYYFAGIRGKRAIVLLSDGRDTGSRYSFEETLDFARRTGVAVYTIGIAVSMREFEARSVLQRLARETGGRYFFVGGAAELDPVYRRIEEELRSQYLLGYQSTQAEGEDFREVRVEVARKGLAARTIPGYYP